MERSNHFLIGITSLRYCYVRNDSGLDISQAPAAEIWLSSRKAREGDDTATGEQFGNLKTCQNGNQILINQVKLYKDKRLQGLCYQGLPRKQIPFVKHYLLSDLQEKTISSNYLQSIFMGK
ncbi:hypothetical protein [Nostoc sp. CHAB 5715]|uniref:hypothetical protein n=1 Tax=Nostoc sp. CHAB 5715 TaxID=2780400 RepID=UPI001E3ECCA3|nr:hypothetical protein [Nostoc sp. CHAB 5715]MCC5626519.1 hypothetical protein [Nostoc sp. CHAB 5715]